MNGAACPNCGSALFVGDEGIVCPSCGWKKRPDGADADAREGAGGKSPSMVIGSGEPSRGRAASGGAIRGAEPDSPESEDPGEAEKSRPASPLARKEGVHPVAGVAVSLGVGAFVAFVSFSYALIPSYVPSLLCKWLTPIVVLPICWLLGSAFLDTKRRVWTSFVCALAFSMAYAFVGWRIFTSGHGGENMMEVAAVYAFMWSVCFGIAGAVAARSVGWFAAVTSPGPAFLALVAVLGAAIGVGIEAGVGHLFGGMLYGYIPSAVAMAGLLLGAAQTGMEHGW